MKLFCGLFVVVFLVAAGVNAHPYEDTHTHVYGLLIDAGSTGSRIYIYTWLQRIDNSLPDLDTAPINQTQWSFKVSPGLSTFANNLGGIPAYLAQLISFAKANLNASDYATTVLFLTATGGLRALAQSDQDNIMAATRTYLATSPFQFNETWAMVIPLEKEALFGWLAVNYEKRTLGSPLDTLGAMDMGGATTEIAFVPADQSPVTLNNTLFLDGIQYNVYAGGYAARGLDASLALILAAVVASSNSTSVTNPCYLTGYSEPYNVTTSGSVTTYTISGSGNVADCRALINNVLLNTSVACATPPCAFNGLYQPPLRGNFYAYSGFYYTYAVFFPSNNPVSLTDFNTAALAFCALNFSAAQQQYPKETLSFLKTYCYTSNYFLELFNTYGFAPDSTNITFAGTIGHYDVSYALGAMLYEANLLPIVTTITTTTSGGSDTTTTTTTTTTGGGGATTGNPGTTSTTGVSTSAPNTNAAVSVELSTLLLSIITVLAMMM